MTFLSYTRRKKFSKKKIEVTKNSKNGKITDGSKGEECKFESPNISFLFSDLREHIQVGKQWRTVSKAILFLRIFRKLWQVSTLSFYQSISSVLLGHMKEAPTKI